MKNKKYKKCNHKWHLFEKKTYETFGGDLRSTFICEKCGNYKVFFVKLKKNDKKM